MIMRYGLGVNEKVCHTEKLNDGRDKDPFNWIISEE